MSYSNPGAAAIVRTWSCYPDFREQAHGNAKIKTEYDNKTNTGTQILACKSHSWYLSTTSTETLSLKNVQTTVH